MDFDRRKAATLASLGSTATDKSPKGTLDTPIIPLLDALNHHPSYFTTSSCSGRISILSQPKPGAASNPNKKKARGGSWVFITHEFADPDSVISLLFPSSLESVHTEPGPLSCTQVNDLVFRFEPLIIAVECRDVKSAQNLVSLAIGCGYRESGITNAGKRVIVGIRCSIRLEVPLGDTQKIMVSEDYVRFLVGIANEKMEANRRRTEGFLTALKEGGSAMNGVFDNGNYAVCSKDGVRDEDQVDLERPKEESHVGPAGVHGCTLSITHIMINGEPKEKLFLWGHSACTLYNRNHNKVLIFSGFGGMGRHARRSETLLLDLLRGTLKEINVVNRPSPCLGHTSSLVGDCLYVIGGRGDPLNILSDIWVLNTVKNEWRLLECTGSVFPPRHRHAAAVVGSKIYVFGGLNNDTISSSFHVLHTDNQQWEELPVSGEWPCARHSHSMVAHGSKIFLFGGYDGEKVLGDLYSFDVQTCLWKKEKVAGRSPHARFSHSMFVYKTYIGVIGGCPVRQHCQELSLLDIQNLMWKHVMLSSISEELFVRCTANVAGDDLIIIGGGAACYAFGTKFSAPIKINLLPLLSLDDHATHVENSLTSTETPEPQSLNGGSQLVASKWVLQLEKKNAKFGKDILKKFGWLDLQRKVYLQEGGLFICFPVKENFCTVFQEEQYNMEEECKGLKDLHFSKPFMAETVLLDQISSSAALNILKKYGAKRLLDEVVEVRKLSKSPLKVMTEAVASLIKEKGLSAELLEQLPTRWERLGDIVVLPVTSFKDAVWDSIGKELWPIVANSLHASHLARQGRVASTGTRDSNLEILVGDNGWVDHRENGILYSFDATKCMFSWGNLSEKTRMANLDCRDEVVVDLFAGIGYFVLPFLVRAKAKLVYACEWNPHAVEALQRNLKANSVSDRCILLEGDNRVTAPKGVADRVCLGLLPSSEGSWVTAVKALRNQGGILHVHGNVKDSEERLWADHVLKSIYEIAKSEGHCWEVTIEHVERVKWYAPHIRHLVADVKCIQIQG
ncbi:hypothetical protein SLEP1_g26722 [Rubroshorea leprosula]|uniref:SAM-dependent methyltransferase TRM5/TYW2-type domain-containing protein n=1 Tax=Rubroshorea leprosula TaxID=152421 RepID=A0AAV5JV25_9ROSI|nr:hypothetical protein SLEP1_g26722 [Rubroshorea leprosula]